MTTFVLECSPSVDEEDYYVALPPKKSLKAKFPLDCRVVFVHDEAAAATATTDNNYQNSSSSGGQGAGVETNQGTRQKINNCSRVYSGTVVQVGIDIGSPLPNRRSNLYKIQCDNTSTQSSFMVSENALQYAPQTPVWTILPLFGIAEWQPAVVLGSVQQSQSQQSQHHHQTPSSSATEQQQVRQPENSFLYSIQVEEVDGRASIYHGVSSQYVSYRTTISDNNNNNNHPPPVSEEIRTLALSVKSAAPPTSSVASAFTNQPTSPAISQTTKSAMPADAPMRSAADVPAAARSLAPAGRGRGATLPAWLTRQQQHQVQPQPQPVQSPQLHIQQQSQLRQLACYNEPSATTTESPSTTETATQSAVYDTINNNSNNNSSNCHSMYILNQNPSPFQYICIGNDHDLVTAMELLRAHRKRKGMDTSRACGVGDVIHKQCLYWQLKGQCLLQCRKARAHQTLSSAVCNILETNLLPVMSTVEGPIYCHSTANLPNEGGAALKLPRTPPPRIHTGANNKRSKQQLRCEPEIAVVENSVQPISKTFQLPSQFGSDLFFSTLNECVVQELCDKYKCTILLLEGKEEPSGNPKAMTVTITCTVPGKIFRCLSELELALFHALPQNLQGYLLHEMGLRNDHRQVQRAVVNTLDRYLCCIRAGQQPSPDRNILSFEQAQRFFGALTREQYPTCDMTMYDQTAADAKYPNIFSHVILFGRDFNDVYDCRRIMLEWLKEESTTDGQDQSPNAKYNQSTDGINPYQDNQHSDRSNPPSHKRRRSWEDHALSNAGQRDVEEEVPRNSSYNMPDRTKRRDRGQDNLRSNQRDRIKDRHPRIHRQQEDFHSHAATNRQRETEQLSSLRGHYNGDNEKTPKRATAMHQYSSSGRSSGHQSHQPPHESQRQAFSQTAGNDNDDAPAGDELEVVPYDGPEEW